MWLFHIHLEKSLFTYTYRNTSCTVYIFMQIIQYSSFPVTSQFAKSITIIEYYFEKCIQSTRTHVSLRSLFRFFSRVYQSRCDDGLILHLFSILRVCQMQPNPNHHRLECDVQRSRSSNDWWKLLLRTQQRSSILTLILFLLLFLIRYYWIWYISQFHLFDFVGRQLEGLWSGILCDVCLFISRFRKI